MIPDPKKLVDIAQITNRLVGFYDIPEKDGFAPFTKGEHCIFSGYKDWMKGKSTCLSEKTAGNFGCPGAGYWNCNLAALPQESVARYLAVDEGLKKSPEIMSQWLGGQPPYRKKNEYVIIGPYRKKKYEYLKTITFFVNPDQLSLLITGAEYCNASITDHPVKSPYYGSGCGLLAAIFKNLDEPKAVIGGTDIAMRSHLPDDILAFTVTKAMFEQLCQLDETSFLYKSFWNNVKRARVAAEHFSSNRKEV